MTISKERLLRRSLAANGIFSLATGIIAAALATPLSEFIEINGALLLVIGVGVTGFGLATLWNARRDPVDLKLARLTIVADAIWVVAAAVLIVGFPDVMTGGGRMLLGLVSIIVGTFAGLQSKGIRRVIGPKRLVTEVEIDAGPDDVWAVLTDLGAYKEWNPNILEGRGSVELGENLELVMVAGDKRTVTMRPTVTEAVPARTFEWLGHLGVRGIFDGRHRFDLVASEGQTRMTQSEEFTGILVPVFSGILPRTKVGFEAMNTAIKTRVETREHQVD